MEESVKASVTVPELGQYDHHSSFFFFQVLYKVYISFVEVGPGNVQTADYFKGVGEYFIFILRILKSYPKQ